MNTIYIFQNRLLLSRTKFMTDNAFYLKNHDYFNLSLVYRDVICPLKTLKKNI
jgi:hypothetical protein